MKGRPRIVSTGISSWCAGHNLDQPPRVAEQAPTTRDPSYKRTYADALDPDCLPHVMRPQ